MLKAIFIAPLLTILYMGNRVALYDIDGQSAGSYCGASFSSGDTIVAEDNAQFFRHKSQCV
jgi:hypothetical protein